MNDDRITMLTGFDAMTDLHDAIVTADHVDSVYLAVTYAGQLTFHAMRSSVPMSETYAIWEDIYWAIDGKAHDPNMERITKALHAVKEVIATRILNYRSADAYERAMEHYEATGDAGCDICGDPTGYCQGHGNLG